jgi:uncharacterized protein (TIGR02246 family)
MRMLASVTVALLFFLAAAAANAQSNVEPAAAAQANSATTVSSHDEDEKAIRLVIDACAKAYNAHNAKDMAALFTPDGEIVNEDGQRTQGRPAIEQVFAAVFQDHPQGQIKIAVEAIRFVGPTVAIEDGVSTVVHQPNAAPERSRYTVVHVKEDGKWQMASARDLPDVTSPAEEQLKEIEWLVGDWVDESPDAMVATSYSWTDNHKFILSEFKVQRSGHRLMTGTQRIGWDPLAGQIHSWVFDSEGGFAEGLWTRNGNQWIAKMTGVTREGKAASSTNITTLVNKDRMTWQSRDRVVGGERTPDLEEIPIARKPPSPTLPASDSLPGSKDNP